MRKILDPSKTALLKALSQVIDQKFKTEGYLISEQDIAEKYKISIEEVILAEKRGNLLELEISNPKIRRATILNNLYKNGIKFYDEVDSSIKSDFTDAIIVNNDGKLLLLKRNKLSKNFPDVYCLPGGHLETAYKNNPEKNVKKEIKEETGLDPLECKLVYIKNINSSKNKIYYFYCSLPLDSEEVILNESEHTQYKWVTLSELKELPKENFILDLKEIILDMVEVK